MPIQVFDNNYSTFSSITSGIMYAVHKGADVINVSIGPNFEGLNSLSESQQAQLAQTHFKNEEKVWDKIISIANKKNSIIVFAAGNNDILTKILPECRTNQTINVAAVNKSLTATEFTNYGVGSNISAPGEDIYSSFPVKSFRYCDGTSMAAPIVSGTIALLKSLKKNITVTQVLGVLQASGRKIQGNVPPMVQVDKALAFVRSGRFPNPIQGNGMANQPVFDNGGNEAGIIGSGEDGSASGTVPQAPDRSTNYDEIRKLIRIYQEKIRELEKQLPNGK
jgi:subtilisin family serine protease